jgi:hypothetical protein
VETAYDSPVCRTRCLVVVIGAAESSSGLVAPTRQLGARKVAASAAKAIERAHAPINFIAFIVLAIPRIAMWRTHRACEFLRGCRTWLPKNVNGLRAPLSKLDVPVFPKLFGR